MNSGQPKVSVLMLTYNHRQFIATALESALAQQCPFEYEIVVGDDCSTDGTSEIIDCFASSHPQRIRVSRAAKNMGMVENFDAALALCRGDYIALLEGDDFWSHERKLEQQATYLDEHPHCALVFHPVTVSGGPQDRMVFPSLTRSFLNTDLLLGDNVIPTCSVMFRRAVLPRLPDWFHGLAVLDWPLYVHISLAGSADVLGEPMGVYRVHSNGAWSQASLRQRYVKVIGVIQRFATHLPQRYLARVDGVLAEYLQVLAWRNEVEQRREAAMGVDTAWFLARKGHCRSLVAITRAQAKAYLRYIRTAIFNVVSTGSEKPKLLQ